MATSTRDELIDQLKNGVVEFDEDAVVEASESVVENGLDAYDAVMNGLAEGMNEVGERFGNGTYFVPEVLMAADALYKGLDILRPHVKLDASQQIRGSVVIGTVEGDVHDIGKNLVKLMFEIAGFEVHDLGKDVPLDKFVEEQLRTDSDFVCLSAMMTTTMVGMPIIIQKIKAKNPNVRIMVGGAPVSADIAQKFGADGYGEDAPNALQEALRMVSSIKELQASATKQ
ncbi:MAG TPA: corrinoid protein [Anaerolineales bacterium]|nr:corrinoid protein [Anaerolineales bacterium]